MTGHQRFYIKFFIISPEYNKDSGICIKAYHLITIQSSEESRFQNPKNRDIITDNGQRLGEHWGIKNCSVHCATNNWMIIIGDGKARGQRMMTEKINELDQLLLPAS